MKEMIKTTEFKLKFEPKKKKAILTLTGFESLVFYLS